MSTATSAPMYIVDAFTTGNNDTFTGGPAAIVLLPYDDEMTDDAKLRLAKSNNLSETAYVALDLKRPAEGEQLRDRDTLEGKIIRRTLRWFTPAYEVPLCGHATAGAAKVLLKHYQLLAGTDELLIERIEFQTNFMGTLTCDIKKDENGAEIVTVSLPANPTESINLKEAWIPSFLGTILGPSFPENGLESVTELAHAPSMRHYLLMRLKEVKGEAPALTIGRVEPSYEALLAAESGEYESRLIIVTIKGDGGPGNNKPDFYCRIFAPHYGVKEDPVCGSAHGLLVPYWTKELSKEGQVVNSRQLSWRGGALAGKHEGEHILLSGTCRVVLTGGNFVY